MGRMSGQIDETTKQSRLEELMLAQQQVVFSRNAARVGETIEVIINSLHGEADDGATMYSARSKSQAPDIDSVIYVTSMERLHPGEMLDVVVTDYQQYDLVAEPAVKASRALKVLAG